MTVIEATTPDRLRALLDRAMAEDDHVTERDVAFGWIVARGWVRRVGADGIEAEFHSVRDGQRIGWKLSPRGHQVAEEQLAVTAGSA